MSINLMSILEGRVKDNPEQFPRVSDNHCYFKQYGKFSEHMYDYVHPLVTVSASAKDGGLLTDHGPEHIRTVIERAGYLLSESHAQPYALSGFEIYILLCSIHFHDVGNMYGRDRHEAMSAEVMKGIGILLGANTAENKVIQNIAQAHGGVVDGDKDTISFLEGNSMLHSLPFRQRLLAAILRFADELADDSRRSSRFLDTQGLIPQEAQVFHQYALSLSSVSIAPGEKCIDYVFEVPSRILVSKMGKNDEEVYLLDEIFKRTDKSFTELIYCSRFMRPIVDFEVINVVINVNDAENEYREPIKTIPYRLEERGYPVRGHKHISDICHNLKEWCDGKALTGESFAKRLLAMLEGGD